MVLKCNSRPSQHPLDAASSRPSGPNELHHEMLESTAPLPPCQALLHWADSGQWPTSSQPGPSRSTRKPILTGSSPGSQSTITLPIQTRHTHQSEAPVIDTRASYGGANMSSPLSQNSRLGFRQPLSSSGFNLASSPQRSASFDTLPRPNHIEPLVLTRGYDPISGYTSNRMLIDSNNHSHRAPVPVPEGSPASPISKGKRKFESTHPGLQDIVTDRNFRRPSAPRSTLSPIGSTGKSSNDEEQDQRSKKANRETERRLTKQAKEKLSRAALTRRTREMEEFLSHDTTLGKWEPPNQLSKANKDSSSLSFGKVPIQDEMLDRAITLANPGQALRRVARRWIDEKKQAQILNDAAAAEIEGSSSTDDNSTVKSGRASQTRNGSRQQKKRAAKKPSLSSVNDERYKKKFTHILLAALRQRVRDRQAQRLRRAEMIIKVLGGWDHVMGLLNSWNPRSPITLCLKPSFDASSLR